MVIVWSVVAATSALGRLFNVSRSRSHLARLLVAIADLLFIVAIPSLLWLLWDARAEPAFACCVMLAAVPMIRTIAAAASIVFTIPFTIVQRYFREAFRGIEGRGLERSDVFIADSAAGARLTVAGNAEVERMLERAGRGPRWGARLICMLVLPLLALYWLV